MREHLNGWIGHPLMCEEKIEWITAGGKYGLVVNQEIWVPKLMTCPTFRGSEIPGDLGSGDLGARSCGIRDSWLCY